MRKRLSSGQKWFLTPYFPLIRGMFAMRSGIRFSFRAFHVPATSVHILTFSIFRTLHVWNILGELCEPEAPRAPPSSHPPSPTSASDPSCLWCYNNQNHSHRSNFFLVRFLFVAQICPEKLGSSWKLPNSKATNECSKDKSKLS